MLSRTQKKNATRRAKEREATVGILCDAGHPLKRESPMVALTKYGIENAICNKDYTVACNHCAKCREGQQQDSFGERVRYLYQAKQTSIVAHNVICTQRVDEFNLNIISTSFAGHVIDVEEQDDKFFITAKLRYAFKHGAVPDSFEIEGDGLRMTIGEDQMRIIVFTLSNGNETHPSITIGTKCKKHCPPENCEHHTLREPVVLSTMEESFEARIRYIFREKETAVTLHDVVFAGLNGAVYAGSFRGYVHSVESGLLGTVTVTAGVVNANACEPVPDTVARVLPPKYVRMIALEKGTRVVRIVFHGETLKHPNLMVGSSCNKKCNPEECKYHDLRNPQVLSK